MSDLTHRSTSEELADPASISRDHVLHRLGDWRDRVHKLYDEIERTIQGSSFRSDRHGKQTSDEELPRKFGITENDQPQIDILRIVRADGTSAAVLYPRGLWIIGANGRIDLRVTPPIGGTETYMLMDHSRPLTGASQWVRVPLGAPFDREPFDSHWLLSKLH